MSIYIGCHLSVTDGYEAMGKTMVDFGGNTFAFFTRNPRGGQSKELQPDDVSALLSLLERERFGPLVAHGSYTMNLCAANEQTRENGLDMLRGDLLRMEQIPGNMYNFHPGAHVGQGIETGILLIAGALNEFLKPDMHTTVLLETMAGKGTEIGGRFEELREIIDRVDLPGKVGVTWTEYSVSSTASSDWNGCTPCISMTARTSAAPTRIGMRNWGRARSALKRCGA